jgi:hypothetical protein
VIQDNDKPLAVLLKYEHFLAMQELGAPSFASFAKGGIRKCLRTHSVHLHFSTTACDI